MVYSIFTCKLVNHCPSLIAFVKMFARNSATHRNSKLVWVQGSYMKKLTGTKVLYFHTNAGLFLHIAWTESKSLSDRQGHTIIIVRLLKRDFSYSYHKISNDRWHCAVFHTVEISLRLLIFYSWSLALKIQLRQLYDLHPQAT